MKIQRLIAILTILLRTDITPAPQLAKKFGVSVRTIYRDIQTLESAGIPIISVTGVHGGVGILPQYKMDKQLFTHQDIARLLTGLNSVAGSINSPGLNQTLEKIRAFIPDSQLDAIEMDARKLHIDLSPWSGNAIIGKNLDAIYDALQANQLIRFNYTTLKQDASTRIVEPHQLVLKESNWYLRAYCLNRSAFRLFKLRRIVNIQHLPGHFTPRDFPNRLHDFKEWTHPGMIEIELLIDETAKEILLDKCHEDDMTELENGKIHVRLNFVPSDLGYGFLMQLGEKCECIAPDYVRNELVMRLDRALSRYQNPAQLLLPH